MNSCCLVIFLALLFVGYLIYKQTPSITQRFQDYSTRESYLNTQVSGSCSNWSNPYSGNNYGEYNESCWYDPRRHCTLCDGSLGKCVMNGICMPSFL